MNGVFNFAGATIIAWGVGAHLGGPNSHAAQCGAAILHGVFGTGSGFRGMVHCRGGSVFRGFWAGHWAMILWGLDTPDIS